MLTKNDRTDLKWAMQAAILEQARLVTESKQVSQFILKEATYEQMLNLCFNSKHKTSYQDAEVLENVAISCILEAAGHGEPSVKTTKDKYELLESILYEISREEIAANFPSSDISGAADRIKQMKLPPVDPSKTLGRANLKKWGKRGAIAGGVLAAGAALYYLYKKLRGSGKSPEEAAAQVAQQADNPEDKQKWAAKAKQYSANK